MDPKIEAGLIYKKIPEVMAEIDAIAKTRANTQQNYKFRGIDDFYNELHPLLSRHRIFSVPKIVASMREERPSKAGGLLIWSVLDVMYTFCAEDGSKIEVGPIRGEGMDSGDKASNKAMAAAHKYALLQLFAIPTEDEKDSENDSHNLAPRGAPTGKPKPETPKSRDSHGHKAAVGAGSAGSAKPTSPSTSRPSTTGTGDKTRDALNAKIMALYRPFMTKNPNTRFVDLLEERYQVNEIRLMTVEQVQDLVAFLEKSVSHPGVDSGAPKAPVDPKPHADADDPGNAHPDAISRRTELETQLLQAGDEMGWDLKQLDALIQKKLKKSIAQCSNAELEMALVNISKMKGGKKK